MVKNYGNLWQEYFNSHAHVERDQLIKICFACYINFNSHAHVERDFFDRYYHIISADFNSHAHVERDSERYSAFCKS